MREDQNCTVNTYHKFKLACCSVQPWLLKLPFWKFSPLLEALQPLAPCRQLHVVTSSLGKWVATYRQAIRPRHCLRLLAAAHQAPLSSFRAVQQVKYLPTQPARARHSPAQEGPKFIVILWLLRGLCASTETKFGEAGVLSQCLSIIINAPNLSCGQQGVILTAEMVRPRDLMMG